MPTATDPKFPTSQDLVSQIRFDTGLGKVWMHEQRMLLVHSSLFQNLRNELITTIGEQRTRGLLMRLGFHSGWRDAELARKLRPELSTANAFAAGPQLAMIKGMVNVTPVRMDFDLEEGSFYGEFLWDGAFEADLQLAFGDRSDTPVCWILTGYASGFTTFYMGRQVLFREVECQARGNHKCRIVGRPADEWDDPEELSRILQPDALAEELLSLQSQLSELQTSQHDLYDQDELAANSVGNSRRFRDAWRLLQKAAANDVSVLLQGETGVGKEIFARSLHLNSPRAEQPFVAVNCACIPPDLIESELFGVEKGAFTGAHTSRPGKFERANSGTLFLDEVVELSPRAQATLLRVLQEGELERVGGAETRKIDVRLVVATNENLEEAVTNGKFRADLFYRLNIYPVHIPALRERRDDIPLLVDHFLRKFQIQYRKKIPGISDKARQALMEYNWPGNIRELENMVERGIILTENNQLIDLDALCPALEKLESDIEIAKGGHLQKSFRHGLNKPDPVCESMLEQGFEFGEFERRLILTAMLKADGNVSQAARLLGLSRAQIAYRLEKLNYDNK
ncbi:MULTISPECIES: sigma-54-dependent Fis family transcriptional regulator [Marinobacter]|jgi:DNA-binding NtrC family response regulator|uniref:Helix-turn-helix, Fis-type n=1 Tax=Marinobacter algicola DG893 TaxID=443152 RepID=A6F4A1_9GAMM|nr:MULTISPECIES: sigma-54-dependent Fis family transcriptional regulator [Marinobacter]EDM46394.1 Helix-turn-helix, Fis-type [Marinobacter algicola DG893]MBW4980604.1 sigma 54-interacting transcriptional regulator [Marinobacter adhaerens]ODM31499.1 sigma-54-dependent Fis family transcriptional regulator [Marinobacter adhaerens]OLF81897.1 Fis family transcriptional regulator [Marinobacter sp. C18]QTN40539.1 sigma 54-interacting transcriptional regulator [Marinobacter salsuginis]|tara:strand:- start:6753 stop:8459 length:1707 start_codon:yes stop_codon:yes gene_type:complete